jgi:hypothetical protein
VTLSNDSTQSGQQLSLAGGGAQFFAVTSQYPLSHSVPSAVHGAPFAFGAAHVPDAQNDPAAHRSSGHRSPSAGSVAHFPSAPPPFVPAQKLLAQSRESAQISPIALTPLNVSRHDASSMAYFTFAHAVERNVAMHCSAAFGS